MPRSAKPDRSSECVIVLGPKGSGKSHWSKGFVDALRGAEPVLVWDPKGEWCGPVADRPVRRAERFPSTSALCAWIAQHNPRLEGRRLVVQPPRVAAPPGRARGRPLPPHYAEFERLCALAADAGDCWLVVDEAATYCRADVIPETLRELLQVSRHHRVSALFIAQRPTHLHPDLRDNRDRCILFQMTGEASCAWVRGEFGKSTELSMRKLRKHTWIEATRGALPECGTEESGPRRRQDRRGSSDPRKA